MDIKFVAASDDGNKWDDKDFPLHNLVYMHIRANDESFSGWVSPDVRRLVHSAPDNQRKVYEFERLIARLYKLLPDAPDEAYDLVRAEHLSIHGPSDNGAEPDVGMVSWTNTKTGETGTLCTVCGHDSSVEQPPKCSEEESSARIAQIRSDAEEFDHPDEILNKADLLFLLEEIERLRNTGRPRLVKSSS